MDFAGKTLFVHCKKGFDDTIQFIRYLPQFKTLGSIVVLEAQREQCILLQGFAGIDEMRPLSFEQARLQDFDLQIPLMSLCGIFETTLYTIFDSVFYIHATIENHSTSRAALQVPNWISGWWDSLLRLPENRKTTIFMFVIYWYYYVRICQNRHYWTFSDSLAIFKPSHCGRNMPRLILIWELSINK